MPAAPAQRARPMAPKFGTSGLRGLVTELTDALVADHVRAFLATCDTGAALHLGRDLRESSPHLARVVADAARDAGVALVDCGALPTPALALAAMTAGSGAVMVTGSHIPADRNGLKFYTVQGEITKSDETAILGALGRRPQGKDAPLRTDPGAIARFRARYLDAFGSGALTGARIGVWSHSSVGRDLLIDLLRDLGATVTELGRSATFIPVDTEAVDADTRARLRRWASEMPLDAIVSTDGDADRPLLTDAKGAIVPGDVLGQITARFLGAGIVVTPVSSNTGADLSGAFGVVRTRIGSPFVIAAMAAQAGQRVVGYEANGGFLLGFDATGPTGPLAALPTRDCILPILATLVAARTGTGADTRTDIAARVAAEPARFTAADRLEGIESATATAFLDGLTGNADARRDLLTALALAPDHTVDTTDGLRLTDATGTVLHLRPSGNAPEFRVYAEAGDAGQARDILADALGSCERPSHHRIRPPILSADWHRTPAPARCAPAPSPRSRR